MPNAPCRGEIWLANLALTRGHEQAGARPVLVISNDTFNRGPAGLVLVLPLTRRNRNVPLHLPVDPPEGGLTCRSYILCDSIRSISKDRLGTGPWGIVSAKTMHQIEDLLRLLMDL